MAASFSSYSDTIIRKLQKLLKKKLIMDYYQRILIFIILIQINNVHLQQSDHNMTNLLKRQFAEGRFKNVLTQYNKFIGLRKPKILDRIIPNLTENLCKASESFIEAIVQKDLDFIEHTATLALKNKLKAQFKSMGQNSYFKKNDSKAYLQTLEKTGANMNKIKQLNGQFLLISPYVIFGQNITQRSNSEKPWDNVAPFLAMNRYVYINPDEKFTWQTFKNNQIYGFYCHFTDYKYQYEIYQNNNEKIICPPTQFVLTFQTDSQKHDFMVADFNYFIKEQLN